MHYSAAHCTLMLSSVGEPLLRQSIDLNFSALIALLLAPGCVKEINDDMTKVHEHTLVPVFFVLFSFF